MLEMQPQQTRGFVGLAHTTQALDGGLDETSVRVNASATLLEEDRIAETREEESVRNCCTKQASHKQGQDIVGRVYEGQKQREKECGNRAAVPGLNLALHTSKACTIYIKEYVFEPDRFAQ